MNVYAVADELTSPRFARAFARGCNGRVSTRYVPGVWAGFGSPQIWHEMLHAISLGFDWYYGDHGYFGRGQFYRVTKNAYQHTGKGKPDFNRLSRWYKKETPFNKNGSKVIVCAQSQNHYDRFGVPNWLDETLDTLHRNTDRDIIVRRKRESGDLIRQLPTAWAVVCHTSNAGVEALMNGVPVFSTAPCAAFGMAKSNLAEIEYPHYPTGRLEWAATLAANQWTLSEIAKGMAWKTLQRA